MEKAALKHDSAELEQQIEEHRESIHRREKVEKVQKAARTSKNLNTAVKAFQMVPIPSAVTATRDQTRLMSAHCVLCIHASSHRALRKDWSWLSVSLP